MQLRLGYSGGKRQEDRMIADKLRSLKKAMLYSYQAATAILEDGREFRCLINPDKTKTEYRDKIISIPYEDICLGRVVEKVDEETGEIYRIEEPAAAPTTKTSNAIETIGLKVGDVFEWKETQTYWMVYLEYLEEDAYFRGEIRNCDYELEINGKKYRGYLRGPDEEGLLWHTKQNISWTDANYTALLYITNNEDTRRFFHRFTKLKIYDKPWEVQVVDPISNEGLIMVTLKEDFNNEMEEASEYHKLEKIQDKGIITTMPKDPIEEDNEFEEEEEVPYIEGPAIVYPYDKKKYIINNTAEGSWSIDNERKAIITHQTDKVVTIEIITGRTGVITLTYTQTNGEVIPYQIKIASL